VTSQRTTGPMEDVEVKVYALEGAISFTFRPLQSLDERTPGTNSKGGCVVPRGSLDSHFTD